MRSNLTGTLPRLAMGLAFSTLALTAASAQTRLSLPAGTVIIVQTETALQSNSAQVGQTFSTTVTDAIGLDQYTVIPSGSRIRGTITFAKPATRQESGVIEVNFDRLTLADGTSYPIVGRLTSTDAAERRQIDSDPNARVVLVGGRGGVGAAIAGAGSQDSPVSNILSALGGLLSQAQDVRVPAGTQLAVQLDQAVSLRSGRRLGTGDMSAIYTAADRVRAAQQALAQLNYYRGSINGQLDDATQRAIFEFQTDKGIRATGNLDGRTAQALGITVSGNGGIGASYGTMLSVTDAATLRRDAQTLAAQQRSSLALTTNNVYSRRTSSQADMDLWFALSAFADNASLYEQLARGSNRDAIVGAGPALLNAARRVDTVLLNARPSSSIQNSWASIRSRLSNLDSTYR
ncbi:MAG TPA: peptidoglycan-binding domain-containing protein [Gemmatimonadaceae bacterium]|nr:peptidoglycan-binding domain-containing protein [Gemmatimonadaceae bacterium]